MKRAPTTILGLMTPFLGLALTAIPAGAADPPELAVMSYGGAFSAAQVEAWNRPFTEATGIRVRMIDSDNPALPIKAMVEAGNVSIDVAAVDSSDAVHLCAEGLVEPIDAARLAPAPDGTPAAQDFLPEGLGDCFVATDVYATALAYDARAFEGRKAPASPADFFDLAAFPGKRGVSKQARFTLELALLGDGVPPDQVYDLLATPEGQDRAFAKLDTIKNQIVWWEAGAQPPQLLADGEVSMTSTYTGRIFTAVVEDAMRFHVIWNGQIYVTEGWVIPKGAPNPQAAMDYVVATTTTPAQAAFTRFISYGPPRASSQGLVGLYKDDKTPMAPHLPSSPANMVGALAYGTDFWADHDAELTQRFTAWLSRP
ncbi:ABC transporter substrate-binding protein [Paracoccus sp. p4-l81]|uniref:ABC transporter substrate-binding protein n=1 Tax=Paracoccus sp. p4-l81 TaxID=3342806 RepID=UPI0035B9AB35